MAENSVTSSIISGWLTARTRKGGRGGGLAERQLWENSWGSKRKVDYNFSKASRSFDPLPLSRKSENIEKVTATGRERQYRHHTRWGQHRCVSGGKPLTMFITGRGQTNTVATLLLLTDVLSTESVYSRYIAAMVWSHAKYGLKKMLNHNLVWLFGYFRYFNTHQKKNKQQNKNKRNVFVCLFVCLYLFIYLFNYSFIYLWHIFKSNNVIGLIIKPV